MGAVSAKSDDSGSRPELVVSYQNRQIKTYPIYTYGYSCVPPVGQTQAVITQVAASDSNTISFASSPQIRFKNLQEGEVKVGNYLTNSFVFFRRDSTIEINSTESVIIQAAESVTVNASDAVTVTASGAVTINGADSITLNVGAATVTLTDTKLTSTVPIESPEFTTQPGGLSFSAHVHGNVTNGPDVTGGPQ